MSRHVILFLAANPSGTTPLALSEECAAIERELRMTPGRDDLDFRSKWAVSVDDMMRHLNELRPAVVHFSGHGGGGSGLRSHGEPPPRTRDIEPLEPREPREAVERGGIYLQDEHGQPQHVSGRALAQMISSAAPSARVVVLNACFSDDVAEALYTVVDCVVGMRGAIRDEAARSFAVSFYRALGHRCSVGAAVGQAVAVLAALHVSDEHLPVCRTRVGDDASQIFLSSAAPQVPEPGPEQHRLSRRGKIVLGVSSVALLLLSMLLLTGRLFPAEKQDVVDVQLPALVERKLIEREVANDAPKRLEIVSVELPTIAESEGELRGGTRNYPRLDIKLRNPSSEVAYVKALRATIKQMYPVRVMLCNTSYDNISRSSDYKLYFDSVDAVPSSREISLSQAIKANDVDYFSITMSLPFEKIYEMELGAALSGHARRKQFRSLDEPQARTRRRQRGRHGALGVACCVRTLVLL
ncbi:MAG TPA: CHAT domain-containing protein, partial [Kofleriaceae bacterium]|nr:CHAT domain-containing protein [Kofleriaceae bacterium]